MKRLTIAFVSGMVIWATIFFFLGGDTKVASAHCFVMGKISEQSNTRCSYMEDKKYVAPYGLRDEYVGAREKKSSTDTTKRFSSRLRWKKAQQINFTNQNVQ